MSFSLRAMTVDDLDAVLAIEQASSPQPWTERVLRDELADQATRTYTVAVDESGSIVGFCGLLIAADEGHITNIATAPTARRRGVADALLTHTLTHTVAVGVDAVTLEVRVSNTGARALYQRHGFAPVGVRPRYYNDNGEDALIMWLHDVRGARLERTGS